MYGEVQTFSSSNEVEPHLVSAAKGRFYQFVGHAGLRVTRSGVFHRRGFDSRFVERPRLKDGSKSSKVIGEHAKSKKKEKTWSIIDSQSSPYESQVEAEGGLSRMQRWR